MGREATSDRESTIERQDELRQREIKGWTHMRIKGHRGERVCQTARHKWHKRQMRVCKQQPPPALSPARLPVSPAKGLPGSLLGAECVCGLPVTGASPGTVKAHYHGTIMGTNTLPLTKFLLFFLSIGEGCLASHTVNHHTHRHTSQAKINTTTNNNTLSVHSLSCLPIYLFA